MKCDAIPNYSLSSQYIKNFVDSDKQGWEEWNDNEYTNQIVDGVESMIGECYGNGNFKQRQQLLKNYCEFAKGVKRLQTDYYKSNC